MIMMMMSRLPSGARLPTDGRRQKAATEPQMLSFHGSSSSSYSFSFHGSSSYSFFIMVVIIMMLIHSLKSFQNIAMSETIPKFYLSAKLARTQISSQGGRWQAAIHSCLFSSKSDPKISDRPETPNTCPDKICSQQPPPESSTMPGSSSSSLGLGIG